MIEYEPLPHAWVQAKASVALFHISGDEEIHFLDAGTEFGHCFQLVRTFRAVFRHPGQIQDKSPFDLRRATARR